MTATQMSLRQRYALLYASGAVLGGASAIAAYGAVRKSSQMFGPCVFRGPGTRKSVALTFDDGPSKGTLPLLDYLAKEGIRATFFQCGMNILRHASIAGQVAAGGHEIGNHTFSHPHLPFKSREFIDHEFTETQKIIAGETGVTPMLLRPPYGLRWVGLQAVQEKLALLGVLWTVIGNDWKWPAPRIASRVLHHASPGGIICLHDGRAVEPNPETRQTLAAIREIVPMLKDQGYGFETVSDILSR
jgi:peptidoglycan/xylan/chitin deacetylase (PgdA/CDA1 family)